MLLRAEGAGLAGARRATVTRFAATAAGFASGVEVDVATGWAVVVGGGTRNSSSFGSRLTMSWSPGATCRDTFDSAGGSGLATVISAAAADSTGSGSEFDAACALAESPE